MICCMLHTKGSLYNVHCTLYIVLQYAVLHCYTVHCTLFKEHRTLSAVHFHFTLYAVHVKFCLNIVFIFHSFMGPAVYPKLFILPFYKFTKPPAVSNCFNFLMKFFCFTRFQIFHFSIYIHKTFLNRPVVLYFFQYLFTKPFCITPVVYIFQYLFTKPRHTKKGNCEKLKS